MTEYRYSDLSVMLTAEQVHFLADLVEDTYDEYKASMPKEQEPQTVQFVKQLHMVMQAAKTTVIDHKVTPA